MDLGARFNVVLHPNTCSLTGVGSIFGYFFLLNTKVPAGFKDYRNPRKHMVTNWKMN